MSNLKFLSIYSPRYLTILFTATRRPSHKIFGYCVAVLAPGVITSVLGFAALILSLLSFIQRLAASTLWFIKVSTSFSFETLTIYSTVNKCHLLDQAE